MADHATIIAIALCAICAFTVIACIAIRDFTRPDEPGEEDIQQTIEIKVPAIILVHFRTKKCACSQQKVNIMLEHARHPATTAEVGGVMEAAGPAEAAGPEQAAGVMEAAGLAEVEPITRSLPCVPRLRYQDAQDDGTPAAEDGERRG